MECLLGLRGSDFVILASDTSCNRSVVCMKKDSDKFIKLSNKMGMLVCGDAGDTVQFGEYIAKNIKLYKMINGYELSANAAVSFTRNELAQSLRTVNAFMVNMLIGGVDIAGPHLFYMDHLASLNSGIPFAMHGYGSFFGLSILDRHYRPDLKRDEAIELIRKVITEVGHRFIINLPAFKVRIIDSNGIEELPDFKLKI